MNLNELANFFGTDKGDFHFEKHNYAEVYEKYLGHLKNEKINYVEIGVNDPRFPGASIQMWSTFFPQGVYRGLDINLEQVKKLAQELPNVYLYNVDQTKEDQLIDFAEHVPPFDFVVDDGIHTAEAQITSYRALFPYVKPGGYYFIEDCHAKNCHITINLFTGSTYADWFQTMRHKVEFVKIYNDYKLIVVKKHES
jgi:demethylmacrocin O-methyltransferase